ncbi:MAG: YdcH family protein [Hasllibacter sp.]
MPEEDILRIELSRMREEHRDLGTAIEALEERGTDPLTVRRLKKRKLGLKDRMAAIEDRLTPDIIA